MDNDSSHPGWGKDSRQARSIAILLREHIHSDKLGETCKRVPFGFRQECETFLRAVLEKGQDQIGVRFKLSDYRGKVVLLYFWQLV